MTSQHTQVITCADAAELAAAEAEVNAWLATRPNHSCETNGLVITITYPEVDISS